MGSEQTRSSIFAIKNETTTGVLEPIAASTDFLILRSGGFNIDPQIESLQTNELIAGSLGDSASVAGKESPTGSYGCYVKNTGSTATAPLWTDFMESLIGSRVDNATEYATIAGSSTTVLKVTNGGTLFRVGQAVMIKDQVNNYSIRNVATTQDSDVTLNFAVSNACTTGTLLGNASEFIPTATPHPSFSSWLYHANGAAVEAVAGCRCNSANLSFPAAGFAEATFNYSGTKYYFNPIRILSSNKYIDFKEGAGGAELTATLTTGFYRPEELATEIKTKMEAVGAETYTVTWSAITGKYTIASAGSYLSILWNSGTNTANSAKTTLGFANTDSTSALTYTSGTALTWSASYTPSYDVDGVASIVVKNAELFIGNQSANTCVKASEVSVTIDGTITEITSLCSPSGVYEKSITKMMATLTMTTLLEKHRSDYINSLLTSAGLSAMLNVGQKDGSSNWLPSQCFNIYFPNANITQHTIGGDEYRTVSLTVKAYVTDLADLIYVNCI